MSIKASGFTTGKTLWAHITKGKSKRTLKIGGLSGACGGLKTRKRLLPRNAAVGLHTVQFDTFRRYNPKQPVRYRYTVDVRAASRSGRYSASGGWPVSTASGVCPGIGSTPWSNSFASWAPAAVDVAPTAIAGQRIAG